jgi:hypothetical protein
MSVLEVLQIMGKKVILAILCLTIFSVAPAFAENSAIPTPQQQNIGKAPVKVEYGRHDKLPDMAGWMNGEARTTVLDTVSGNRGTWTERNYRTAQGVAVHAVWIDGAGAKGWSVSNNDLAADDGLIGTGATYKTISIAGVRASIDHHPITGYSLAAAFGDGALTLESKLATEKEIISIAEDIIRKMMDVQK